MTTHWVSGTFTFGMIKHWISGTFISDMIKHWVSGTFILGMINPLPHFPILIFPNSATNKDMMAKI